MLIPHQPLVRSFQNFGLYDQTKIFIMFELFIKRTPLNGGWFKMEDFLKYLSNQRSDLPKFWNYLTKTNIVNDSKKDDLQVKMTSNGRLPQISNISVNTHWIPPKFQINADFTKTKFSNVSNEDILQWKTASNWIHPQMEDNLKYQK